jgi:hypothetical protein
MQGEKISPRVGFNWKACEENEKWTKVMDPKCGRAKNETTYVSMN